MLCRPRSGRVARMIDMKRALAAVIAHATDWEGDDEDLVDHQGIEMIVRALSRSGDLTLVPRLTEAFEEFLFDGNSYGRDLIAGILAGIQGAQALPLLLRAAAEDTGSAAGAGLGEDSLTLEISDLLTSFGPACRATVLEFIVSDAPQRRRIGLWALDYVAQPQDQILVLRLATDADPAIRSLAIEAIDVTEDAGYAAIVTALSDPSDDVRVDAISQLGFSGRPEAVAPLASLACDPATRIRWSVVHALARIGSPDAAPALRRMIHDAEEGIRYHAVQALGAIGAVDDVLILAGHDDPGRRMAAAAALAHALPDRRVEHQLRTLARDADPDVRANVLSGLASVGAPNGFQEEVLKGLIDDPDPRVRRRVAATAERLAPHASNEILRRYACDPHPAISEFATAELKRQAR
jgi:HEAT repeat protein